MDDILKDNKKISIEQKLHDINTLHESLTFTREREKDGPLPMLDMSILNEGGHLSSTWYCKASATGLIMNYHALAPKKYKRAVVSGFVHRIYRSCSNWKNVHESVERAKGILKMNQYPPRFYEPIINDTLTRIIAPEEITKKDEKEPTKPYLVFLQYRGKCSRQRPPTVVHRECGD